jgi:hypothetical protein
MGGLLTTRYDGVMKDFSTILLMKILRAIVDYVQVSPDINLTRPGVRETQHTLLEQMVRLQESESHGIQ